MTSPDVIVIGAGVLGLCTAAELGARGHAVTVLDPGGPNASSVAAGMIAPALESLIEGLSPDQAALLRTARDLWPAFAARHGLTLHRGGAEWRGPDAQGDIVRLRALGFAAETVPGGLATPDDWRVEVADAMGRLSAASGVTLRTVQALGVERTEAGWRVAIPEGPTSAAPTLVIATGAAGPLAGLPETVAALMRRIEPIRGQLLSVAGPRLDQVIRAPGVYAVPTPGGVLFGATMEPGVRDLSPSSATAEAQARAGLALLGIEAEAGKPRVGIRGATPDGLPMAGSAGAPGLHLALAPRRNGWLLGPLVARVVADGIEGGEASSEAAALDPLRFP